MTPTSCHTTTGAVPQPAYELGAVFRRYAPSYRAGRRLPWSHAKVMQAIETCRTATLGGHRDHCAQCGFERYHYNSCCNRHCPKCHSLGNEQWLAERRAELLPVHYFHNVFTLPHELNTLILCQVRNQRVLLNLLFEAASQTLLQFGRHNLGGTLGVTMVLHTWDQQLNPHFHVHCLIPGGVLAADRSRWIRSRSNFLFPVRALSRVFRAKFLDGLQKLYAEKQLVFPAAVAGVAPLADPRTFANFVGQLRKPDWVVYCQPPFAGPAKLLEYLARYIRRVAISNNRLLSADNGQVSFHYRDRRDGDRQKVATVPAHEFIRRFLQHILPGAFQRIRHYGLFASRTKQQLLARCRQLLGATAPTPPQPKSAAQWLLELQGIDITRCPQCGHQPLQCYYLAPTPAPPFPVAPPCKPPNDTS